VTERAFFLTFVSIMVTGFIYAIAPVHGFPTPAERTMWYIVCHCMIDLVLIVGVLGHVCICIQVVVFRWYQRTQPAAAWKRIRRVLKRSVSVLIVIGFVFYLLCRAFVVVEAFRELYLAHPAVFVPTWTAEVHSFS